MRFIHRSILFFVVLLFSLGVKSQAQTDSIRFSSTCTNFKIQFGSSVFDRIEFPSKVIWNFGDPSSGFYNTAGTQRPTHSFTSAGDYIIQLTVVLSGDSTKLVDTIHVVDPMAYNFGPDIYLCGNSGDTVITGPSIPGAVYEWNDVDTTRTSDIHVTETGLYTVRINGCAVLDSIGVFFSTKPTIKLGDDHVLCDGEVLTLNASSQNGKYAWYLNGSLLPDTLGQLPVTAPGGQYAAVVTVPGCGVFGDTANITFGALPAPPFSLGVDTLLCPKQIYPLTASVAGATGYKWNTGSGDSTISITNSGTYWAFVTVSGQCEVVDSVIVSYRGDKKLNFRDTAICKGSTLILDADFGTGTYNWVSDPPQRDDQNQTGQSTYYVYEPGLYRVTASVGNCQYEDSLRVSYNDSLVLDIGRDTSLCIGEEFILHVKTNANTFAWQDGSEAKTYPIPGGGTYSVIAQNGCGTDTATVVIDTRHCECELTLPNAFTPNGDGHNETFRPLHPCKMNNFVLRLFNRYGELVYQTQDPSQGWNGNYRMTQASAGTYVWVASYVNADTQQHSLRKGFVILIR